MIKGKELLNILMKNNFRFIAGVPCSILKDFLTAIDKNKNKIKHIISTNEGEAMGIAAGYYLSTSKIPVVYMQNSGLGDALDPLTSLFNKEVYNIPVLLFISWRGEPGKKDATQHIKMGRVTLKLLEILNIPYAILPAHKIELGKEIQKAKTYFRENKLPYAIIIRKGTISPSRIEKEKNNYSLSREEAVRIVIDNLRGEEVVIATTGKMSRELFECRKADKQGTGKDFYNLGSMGCAASIALGIALQKPKKKIFVFDGDGAVLMKMGALATIGHYLPKNFYHIIFDNEAHDSTGGQPTVSNTVNFGRVAKSCGYRNSRIAASERQLKKRLINMKNTNGPAILLVKVRKGARQDLGRPTTTPDENKKALMDFLLK